MNRGSKRQKLEALCVIAAEFYLYLVFFFREIKAITRNASDPLMGSFGNAPFARRFANIIMIVCFGPL